jgi:hypothetical protein
MALEEAKVRSSIPREAAYRKLRREEALEKAQNSTVRLAVFDDLQQSQNLKLPTSWDLISSDHAITKEQVDANTCIGGGFLGGINCLPSLHILGFEKCGTTMLNIWLSRHPNLLSNWLEGRFFDSIKTQEELDVEWRTYLRNQPRIPGGEEGIGKYYVVEKSPAYATNPRVPELVAALVPNTRLLFLTRNPTKRAYSMFAMFTHHYPSVSNALRGQPVSYFIKHTIKGKVEYTSKPGVGGSVVPKGIAPTDDVWEYLSYPPEPEDFHYWVRVAIKKFKENPNLEHPAGRPYRILIGGLYSSHLKKWLQYFPQEHFVIIPSELFHSGSSVDSMKSLQQLLGLPVFDYSKIATPDGVTGRTDIPSIGTFFNSYLNSYHETKPMLEKTKKILDDFYCQSNLELSTMIGGRSLPNYSCAESGAVVAGEAASSATL